VDSGFSEDAGPPDRKIWRSPPTPRLPWAPCESRFARCSRLESPPGTPFAANAGASLVQPWRSVGAGCPASAMARAYRLSGPRYGRSRPRHRARNRHGEGRLAQGLEIDVGDLTGAHQDANRPRAFTR
jgi:hypothetical protein